MKIKKIIKLYLLFFGFCALENTFSEEGAVNIVIFVHGTIISRKDVPKLLFNFNEDGWKAVENKRWKRKIETLRALYGNDPGLHLIHSQNISKKIYTYVFTPFKNNFELYFPGTTAYYTFNWSGSLLSTARKNASIELATAIIKLKKQYPGIKITIICHSHGGNVLLETATILQNTEISIDHVILLGTPIGKKTESWAQTKNKNSTYVFKKIINIFSRWDWLQPLDIFFNNYGFCSQSFSRKHSKETNIINHKENSESHWSFYYLFSDTAVPFVVKIPKILKTQLTL